MTDEILLKLTERGAKFLQLALGSHYMSYQGKMVIDKRHALKMFQEKCFGHKDISHLNGEQMEELCVIFSVLIEQIQITENSIDPRLLLLLPMMI